MNRARLLAIVTAAVVSILFGGCKSEQRTLRASPVQETVVTNMAPESDLRPGGKIPETQLTNPYANNAAAIQEGQKLFGWYNCSGCHFQGGGGIGPPFIDHNFTYGNSPADIFNSIVQGRPQGMPAWGRRIPQDQVWKLVTYVQSLNGATPKWITPPRTDHLEPSSPQ